MSSRMHRGGAVAITVAVIALVVALTRSEPEPVAVAVPVATTTTTTIATTTTTVAPTTAPPTTEAPPAEPVSYETVPPPPPNPGPPAWPTTVATATNPETPVYTAPNGAVVANLASPIVASNQPLNFKVIQDVGGGWLFVSLRTRPNGSTGYIRSTDVSLQNHNWSIDVDRTARWITVYDGDAVFMSAPVVIGTQYTPTPLGDFFTTEGVWETYKYGPHGSFVFGLSAHSDVFTEFGGGDGQIGIHGTNAPWFLGSAASNGCVRLADENVVTLAKILPPGVPVRIHA